MDYSLFFDETFHDRKITINPKGIINTMTDNKNDAYIGLFWGCEKYRLPGAVEKLEAVENKYINRFGLIQIEFKSTNISRKHFNNGVRSFVPNTFDFYYDFFIVTCLYSDIYLKEENEYHFKHWLEQQFFCEQKTEIK